jgi:tetratricopeptide (TPR) repeat protein
VVNMEPYCFRAHDTMSEFFGVSTQHVTTMLGPQGLEHFISMRIPAVEELPASVKERLFDNRTTMQVAKLLDKAGAPESDAGEPAWGAMGHIIRETRFVQVFRRLYFVKFMLCAPADEVWNDVRSDVADHRYTPYLEAMAMPGRDSTLGFQKLADGLNLIDIETTESTMNRSLYSLQGARAKAAWNIAMAHEDQTAEMALSMSQSSEEHKLEIAQEILKVSPFNSYARAISIRKNWDAIKDKVPTWEKESGDSPALFAALALHYSATKDYAAAERTISRYMELSPDLWACQTLAANYKAQGKVDRWLETLENFLNNVEDLGLDHAKVRVEIADHYMGLKQWDKAKPYAEAAAQTWAGWAMECAGRCAEAEKDWERAESWYSRDTERYPDSAWAVWYLFCKRTNQGNLAAAREFAERYVTTHADRPQVLNPEYAGCFYWLDGRQDKAKESFSKAYEKSGSVAAALCLAMIADGEKDPVRRDALLKEITTIHAAKAPRSAAICKLFVETTFDPNGKKPVDAAALDQLVESMPAEGRGNASLFVGWFLKNQGDAKSAKKYLQNCSQSPHSVIWYRYLADGAIEHSASD